VIALFWACTKAPEREPPPQVGAAACSQHVAVSAAGSLAWHPDGQRIATGRAGGGVAVWDAHTGGVLAVHPGAQPAQALVWGPDGILWAAMGPKVTGFAPDGSEVEGPRVPLKHIAELAWTSEGLAAWGSTPRDPRPGTDTPTSLLYVNGDTPVTLDAQRLALTPDGQLLAGDVLRFEAGDATEETPLGGRAWDLAIGERWYGAAMGRAGVVLRSRTETSTRTVHGEGNVLALDLHGDRLVWGADDGRVVVTNLLDDASTIVSAARPDAAVVELGFSPDGSRLAVLEGDVLRVWTTLPDEPLTGFERVGELVDAVFLDDDTLLEARRGQLRWWSTADWSTSRSAALEPSRVHRLALAPEGDRLALGRDQGFRLLEPRSGRHLDDGVFGGAPQLSFGPHGRLWVGVSGDSRLRWVDGREDDLRLQGGEAPAAWSAGGRLATGGLDRSPRIWDLERGGAQVLQAAPGDFYALSWSPDGDRLHAWMRGDRIWTWDVADGTGSAAGQVPTHLSRAFGHGAGDPWLLDGTEVFGVAREGGGPRAAPGETPLAGSPNGSLLVTVAADHRLRVWDRATAECVAVLSR